MVGTAGCQHANHVEDHFIVNMRAVVGVHVPVVVVVGIHDLLDHAFDVGARN